jgi:hypothetical protein
MLINGVEVEIKPGANLRGEDLRRANLSRANLSRADLREASLSRADLRDASLSRADLSGADLRGADLREASLREASLIGADLREASLIGADLRRADLRRANLRRANLREASLIGADLRRADLSGADLREASLSRADLSGAENLSPLVAARTVIAGEGELIGWKKLSNGVVCKLRIPTEAKRSNATGRKCRAEFAVVLEGAGRSKSDSTFVYEVGAIVRPQEPFSEDRWDECASGIHFFLTREEAEAY